MTATLDLLTSLLETTGSADHTHTTPKSVSRDALLQDSLQRTAAAFDSLRDPNISVREKANFHHEEPRLIGTGVQLRIDLSIEASQLIHMMQKFHRVDHASTKDLLCESSVTRHLTLQILSLEQLGSASLSNETHRQPRFLLCWRSVLLKMPFAERQAPDFRVMIDTYFSNRDAMGLGRSSNPETFRHVE
ncbi:unnamed protein product [Phytophthora lilii]|uniref:Unnamed protein product n=1 Tax=Phytophthora lilii TaxID=2077276 RepID=A0A9W6U1C0_9STRA|nr:unnamed protein product [Phytophthora lilii]